MITRQCIDFIIISLFFLLFYSPTAHWIDICFILHHKILIANIKRSKRNNRVELGLTWGNWLKPKQRNVFDIVQFVLLSSSKQLLTAFNTIMKLCNILDILSFEYSLLPASKCFLITKIYITKLRCLKFKLPLSKTQTKWQKRPLFK